MFGYQGDQRVKICYFGQLDCYSDGASTRKNDVILKYKEKY